VTRLTQGDHGKILVDRSGEGCAYVSICTIVGSVYFACNVYSAISYKLKKNCVFFIIAGKAITLRVYLRLSVDGITQKLRIKYLRFLWNG